MCNVHCGFAATTKTGGRRNRALRDCIVGNLFRLETIVSPRGCLRFTLSSLSAAPDTKRHFVPTLKRPPSRATRICSLFPIPRSPNFRVLSCRRLGGVSCLRQVTKPVRVKRRWTHLLRRSFKVRADSDASIALQARFVTAAGFVVAPLDAMHNRLTD